MSASPTSSSRWHIWRDVLGAFLVLRVITLLVAGYVTGQGFALEGMPDSVWLRWDTEWYVQIATEGYQAPDGSLTATGWLPVYPLLIRAVMLLGFNPVVAGLLVSNISFVLALRVLYELVIILTDDSRHATWTVWNLALFPSAVFFVAAYTESTFLLVTLLATVTALRRQWLWAGLFGAIAAATRLQGITTVVLLASLWLSAYGWTILAPLQLANWRKVLVALREEPRGALGVLLVPCGLLLYVAYLGIAFGEPLRFLQVHQGIQTSFGILGPIDTVLRTIQAVLTNETYIAMEIVGLVVLAWVIAMLFPVWRRLGESYGLYILAHLLLITWGGPIHSMGRFVLVMFPVFIILGQSRMPLWRLALFISFLTLFTFVFAMGSFVG